MLLVVLAVLVVLLEFLVVLVAMLVVVFRERLVPAPMAVAVASAVSSVGVVRWSFCSVGCGVVLVVVVLVEPVVVGYVVVVLVVIE